MKIQMFLCFLGLSFHGAAAVSHSLKILFIGPFPVQNLPGFIILVLVDDVLMTYYDSNITTMVPRQDWLKEVVDEEFWKSYTKISLYAQQTFIGDIERAKQLYNQTEGVLVVQLMCGCEWDEETGEVKGYSQLGYDGEDFLSFDLKTESWTAANQFAEIMKHQWDNNKPFNAGWKNDLDEIFPKWLKEFVNLGRRFLMRTVLPSVSLLQKSSSSPVSCHATGFYPDRADLFWRRDGEEIHEGVKKGQILPNNDGTFQMSVDLQLPPEAETHRYECVFQLSGVKEDVITELEKEQINTNEGLKPPSWKIITGVVVAVVVDVVAVVAIIVYYRKKGQSPRSRTEVELTQMSA
ncbi:major histocompatibility complex class I-related gene protein-like isoform X1 [Oryzias latipes]|uniref:Major histocompatibility complex class I-related protein-like n=1 Tax=Oryzias latipes TaxID=8090 RepID=F5HRI2_ORYLA|nr:nonclassical MHC class I molecule, alpha chain [Oryzias latipes]